MPPRSEPLLWVQLIGAGVFPLEGLLLLLLLAGSDPGPVPGLERLLCWALGALAPTLLLWHRPADVWSLLLLQAPLRARRPLQQRLSRLQDNLGLRLGLALAGAACLPMLWWLDEHAAVASGLSPLQGSPRLVVLLLTALLLALMLWQWQQLLQALWLLSRSPEAMAAVTPMPQPELEERRLCLGLPLLLFDPLQLVLAPAEVSSRRAAVAPPPQAAPEPSAPPAPSVPGPVPAPGEPATHEEPDKPRRTEATPSPEPASVVPDPGAQASGDGVGVAVEPEQSAEQQEGDQLDQEIA